MTLQNIAELELWAIEYPVLNWVLNSVLKKWVLKKIWYSIQQYLTPTFTKILILSWMFFKSHDTFKKKFQLFFVQLGVVYCCWVLFAVLKKNITLNTTLNPTNLDTLFMTYLYKYHRAICIQNHSKSLW